MTTPFPLPAMTQLNERAATLYLRREEQTTGGRCGRGGADNDREQIRFGSAGSGSGGGSDEGSTGKGTVQGSLAGRDDAEPKAQAMMETGAGPGVSGDMLALEDDSI